MPTYRSVSQGSITNSDAPFAVSKPAGTVQGDLLISFINTSGIYSSGQGISGGGAAWISGPILNPTGNQWEKINWKIAGASEPASYSVFGESGYTTANTIGAIVAFSLAADTAPVIPTSPVWTNTTVTGTPSITPAAIGDIDIRWLSGFNFTSSLSSTPPAGYTELVDLALPHSSEGLTMCLAYKQVTSVSPTGILSFTSTAATNSRGFTVGVGAPSQGFTGWGMKI